MKEAGIKEYSRGLLRRYAPRNDITQSVFASEAKQSPGIVSLEELGLTRRGGARTRPPVAPFPQRKTYNVQLKTYNLQLRTALPGTARRRLCE
jgi:hypothetical protein